MTSSVYARVPRALGAYSNTLNPWLANPRKDVPGTRMTFGGVPSEKQRADIIAYLNSNSDSPQPLPKAADAAPAAGDNPPASPPK